MLTIHWWRISSSKKHTTWTIWHFSDLTLSSPVVSNGYTWQCPAPYWSNPPFLVFWHWGTLALMTERQSARISKIKTGGLDIWLWTFAFPKCRLAPTAKHTGQESGGEFCEIFWSFMQSKSVNNVCKLLQLMSEQVLHTLTGASPTGDFRPLDLAIAPKRKFLALAV